MPPVTRWMIKTSFLYLLLAFLIGLLQALSAVLPGTRLSSLEPVRVHLLVVGWLTLLIFGVVFWMFPKFSREKPRGYDELGWAAYVFMNAGLVLRIFAEPSVVPGTLAGWTLIVSSVLQWLGAAAFVLNSWPRVKEK